MDSAAPLVVNVIKCFKSVWLTWILEYLQLSDILNNFINNIIPKLFYTVIIRQSNKNKQWREEKMCVPCSAGSAVWLSVAAASVTVDEDKADL